jgi:hypothetical protein
MSYTGLAVRAEIISMGVPCVMAKKAIDKALADPFGAAWPDSLVTYLNTPYDPDAEWVKRYKARFDDWRNSLPWADPRIARRCRLEQKQVRDLVDYLLREKNPARRAAALNSMLESVRVTPQVELRSQLEQPPGPRRSPFALRWRRWITRTPDRDHALVALARLFESAYWDALRKCPTCGTYFLAGAYERKKYCKKQCMWLALQRRRRASIGTAERERQRRRAKERYYLRNGRIPPRETGGAKRQQERHRDRPDE